MSIRAQTRTKAASTPTPSFTPIRTGLLQRKCACGGTSGLDGECAGCRKKRLGLQRRATDRSTPSAAPPLVHDVLRSPGRPLDPDARAFMERRFGHDFGRVQVHTGARAAESAEAVDALAYTVGENVVFGRDGAVQAGYERRRLLAHELAHVVQQSGAPATTALPIGDPAGRAERAADQAATAASVPAQPHLPWSLQRQERPQPASAGPAVEVPADLQTDTTPGPLVEATPFHPQHTGAWQNPNLAQVIYPHRDQMLQRFLELYRELEYQDISALPESQREEPLNRVRAQIQEEIARLSSLPTANDPDAQKRVAELRALLESSQGVGRAALQMARSWLRRPVTDLHGDQLLAEVQAQFGISNVPAWVQPLILDYSGMRYHTAHGTWVPPQQLLFAIVEADRPRGFAQSREGRELMRSLQGLSNEQALGRLQAMQRAGQIPQAAWRVIVRHTDLRLETTEADWESAATDEEIDPRWRGTLQRWRQGATTAWRAELMRRNALVVTQIVCNELGEAAQRQRGIRLPGGIAANSEWFRSRASESRTGLSPVETTADATAQEAYFIHGPYVRPEHLRPGAALFFLPSVSGGKYGWSDTPPGGHARVTIIPSVGYPVPWPSNVPARERHGIRPTIRDGCVDEELWTYHVGSDQIWRSRDPKAPPPVSAPRCAAPDAAPIVETPPRAGPEQRQWIKWLHQATVLRRAGNLVVTLETTDTGAGANNRSLASIQSQFVFVGWAPEPTLSGSTPHP